VSFECSQQARIVRHGCFLTDAGAETATDLPLEAGAPGALQPENLWAQGFTTRKFSQAFTGMIATIEGAIRRQNVGPVKAKTLNMGMVETIRALAQYEGPQPPNRPLPAIEQWHLALDRGVLEQERAGFTGCRPAVYRGRCGDHALLPLGVLCLTQVRPDPGVDIDALTDVQRLTLGIEESVHAGTGGQARHHLAQN
jgi:hypothetical protein